MLLAARTQAAWDGQLYDDSERRVLPACLKWPAPHVHVEHALGLLFTLAFHNRFAKRVTLRSSITSPPPFTYPLPACSATPTSYDWCRLMQASSLERALEALGSDGGRNEPGPGDEGSSCDALVCEGKRLQALNLTITQRNADAMSRLSSRSDREAREVMTSLNEDLQKQNSALAAYVSQLTSQNLNLREILKKSEDGRAAIDMQKAAELLVKASNGTTPSIRNLECIVRSLLVLTCRMPRTLAFGRQDRPGEMRNQSP